MTWEDEQRKHYKRQRQIYLASLVAIVIVTIAVAIPIKIYMYNECRNVHDKVFYCLLK